jgi:hypothetical protein
MAGPTPRPGPACRGRPRRWVADGRRTPRPSGPPRWIYAHRLRLGRLHGSPCAAVEPARPTHVSAGANKRTPVVGWGSFAPPEGVGRSQPADRPPHRDLPDSRHAKRVAGQVLALERRHTYVRRHTRPGARRSTLDSWILLASSAGMGSEAAVRRRLTGEATIAVYYRRVFPQLKAGVVGLAGLEPAASSLSAKYG